MSIDLLFLNFASMEYFILPPFFFVQFFRNLNQPKENYLQGPLGIGISGFLTNVPDFSRYPII
jgi:hypothetical protein